MNLLARLEALEARHDSHTPAGEMTAKERAEVVEFAFSYGLEYDRSYDSPITPSDSRHGYWPYTDARHDGKHLLRYDALETLLRATGDDLVRCALKWANRIRPPGGGRADFYYDEGDDVPVVSFWFEPQEGHDLM
ncbi:hypothetical protein ASG35_03060 [Burkholderia sp. Leaf177]|uniref:hypothetical protein n=1 Tax=Burkholderia sp. Leaf177 TaxID=1736287 RepID=UPI0006F6B307|nr:hypothetical protein [Burkholderia sp. Leaf177]KQR90205.1 hypothetical protein ASG35_03060 [Burkholderia sp. Leaf177]